MRDEGCWPRPELLSESESESECRVQSLVMIVFRMNAVRVLSESSAADQLQNPAPDQPAELVTCRSECLGGIVRGFLSVGYA